jgi:hypothetical protein
MTDVHVESGPPALPYCDYCERGRPPGVGPSYRKGCIRHDPTLQEARDDAAIVLAVIDYCDNSELSDLYRTRLEEIGVDENWLRSYLKAHARRLATEGVS